MSKLQYCKNVEAAKSLHVFQSFCHTGDPYSYTAHGKVWLHDLDQKIDERVIIPLMDDHQVESFKSLNFPEPFGICTDYPALL